jgi:hypothetical protein
MKIQRALNDIETDLSYALQNKTSGMLDIGRLLNEAKPLVDHGKWLPWLRRYTALSKSSAENYMKAASWVDRIRADERSIKVTSTGPLRSARWVPAPVDRSRRSRQSRTRLQGLRIRLGVGQRTEGHQEAR